MEPTINHEKAMTHSPVRASPNKDDIMNDLIETVRVEKHEKVDKCWEILFRLKRVTPLTPERAFQEKTRTKEIKRRKKEESPSGPRKKRRISSNPPPKQKPRVR